MYVCIEYVCGVRSIWYEVNARAMMIWIYQHESVRCWTTHDGFCSSFQHYDVACHDNTHRHTLTQKYTNNTDTERTDKSKKKIHSRHTSELQKPNLLWLLIFARCLSLSSFFRGITEFTRLEFSVDGDVDRDSLSSSHMQSKGKQFAVSFIVRWQKARNNKLIPGMNCTLVLLITGILNARIWNVIERFLWPEWFLILLGRPERRNEKIVDIWLFSHTGRRLWLASISTLYAPPNNV